MMNVNGFRTDIIKQTDPHSTNV